MQSRKAICIRGERRCKIALPLSSNASDSAGRGERAAGGPGDAEQGRPGLPPLRRIPATVSLLPLLSLLSDGSRARPSEVGGAAASPPPRHLPRRCGPSRGGADPSAALYLVLACATTSTHLLAGGLISFIWIQSGCTRRGLGRASSGARAQSIGADAGLLCHGRRGLSVSRPGGPNPNE